MDEAACRGPRERHSPGPNLALNGNASTHRPTFVAANSHATGSRRRDADARDQ